MSDIVRKEIQFKTTVEQCWRARTASLFTGGTEIVVYADTIKEAHRLTRLEIAKEAHARGLSVGPLTNEQEQPE